MSLNQSDLLFLRRSLPFWGRLSERERKLVESSAAMRAHPSGSSLHNGAADCTGLFVVKSGQVRTFILSDTGREITLFRLFERDICIFSASCMLKNIRFDVFIEAVENSETILIPTAVYNDLNQNSLAVSDYTNQLLSSRFSDVVWLLEQILFMSFDRRLALFLLEESAISGGDRLPTTHEEIAKNMGTAREVVTRMLRYFQSEGLVALSRGEIRILDRKKLESLSAQAHGSP
ncbi:Crp/Fnr family transcriptional regulator [Caproicibacter sp.]|uniref:Crp/Fnr family transcriptional regulator n=1 Tax=Caproicibacter sp. TaxID=2814884 RepID=UPI003989BA61